MGSAIRMVGHEERLSLVDHLDELRKRLIISGIVVGIAFGFCFWQNQALLHIINKPLKEQTRKQVAKGEGTVGQASLAQQAVLKLSKDTQAALAALAAPGSGLSPAARAQLPPLQRAMARDVARIPRVPQGDNPVTLGVGEPFTTTVTVAFYFALLISLPVVLFEVFGFVLPGLTEPERRAVRPLLWAVPLLFIAGAAFGYFVVLPAAVRFFVNFNASQFNILVQASQFYKFAATILLAMGLIFQVPIVIIGAARAGLVTPRQLRKNRRYAILACAVIAAFLPGDAITLLLETVPLYLLYEASILLAALLVRDSPARAASTEGSRAGDAEPAPEAHEQAEPSVQEMIDHVDPEL